MGQKGEVQRIAMVFNLEKEETYVLGVVGSSKVSRLIGRVSNDTEYSPFDRWTHVAMLHNHKDKWIVHESVFNNLGIFKKNGVRRMGLSKWIKKELASGSEVFIAPMELNMYRVNFGVRNKLRYGARDIFHFYTTGRLKDWFNASVKKADRRGVVCSEYVAFCLPDKIIDSYERGYQPHEYKPVHIQELCNGYIEKFAGTFSY